MTEASATLARRVAHEVLMRVTDGGAWSNAALDAALTRELDLSTRDRGLVTELVYGTLRRALALDWVIDQHAVRPFDEIELKVLNVLRLGVYQLLHTRVPDHAAVSESVELCRDVGAKGATGFVNGVLRSVARERDVELAPPFEVDPAMHLRIKEGLPAWLHADLDRRLPIDELVDYAAAINQPAPTTLRAATTVARDVAVDRLHEAGLEAAPTERSPVGLTVVGHPESLEGWSELGLQGQDEAAQLVTLFAIAPSADGNELIPMEILDACAAPGGKTLHLAQALPEAHITATDLHKRRVGRLLAEAGRLGLDHRIEAHAADVTKPLPFAEHDAYDLVIVDAPCSGLGTLRRHPEIKLTRGPEDVARLAEVQDRILDAMVPYVRPGGRLVYIVCTTTWDEGPQRMTAFLDRHETFDVDYPANWPWPELLGEGGALETWTHRHGLDGFFAVRLVRRASDTTPKE